MEDHIYLYNNRNRCKVEHILNDLNKA